MFYFNRGTFQRPQNRTCLTQSFYDKKFCFTAEPPNFSDDVKNFLDFLHGVPWEAVAYCLVFWLGKGPKRKMSQKVDEVQKRKGGSALKIKKSKILNFDFLMREGGSPDFQGFPKCKGPYTYEKVKI